MRLLISFVILYIVIFYVILPFYPVIKSYFKNKIKSFKKMLKDDEENDWE